MKKIFIVIFETICLLICGIFVSFNKNVQALSIGKNNVTTEKSFDHNVNGYTLHPSLSDFEYSIGEEINLFFSLEAESEPKVVEWESSGFQVIKKPTIKEEGIEAQIVYQNGVEAPTFAVTAVLDNGVEISACIFGIKIDDTLYINGNSVDAARDIYYAKMLHNSKISREEYEEVLADQSEGIAEESIQIKSQSFVDLTGETNSLVRGTIYWTDDKGESHPLQYSKVFIYTDDKTLLGEIFTDVNGNYSLPYYSEKGQYLHIELAPIGKNAEVVTGTGNDYRIIGGKRWTDPGDTAIINYNITMDRNVGQAFQVSQAINVAARYVQEMEGYAIGDVLVKFPHNETENNCFYRASDRTIYIVGGKYDKLQPYASWDVIMHEYGHHVQNELNLSLSPGGEHDFDQDLWIMSGSKKNGVRLAWAEAWATVYAAMGQQYFIDDLANIETVGDARYDSYNSAELDFEHIEEKVQAKNWSEWNEGTIIAILWCLYTDVDVEYDVIPALGHEKLWRLSTNSQTPYTFSDFVEYFYKTNLELRSDFGRILEYFGLAPNNLRLVMSSDEEPPTLVWEVKSGNRFSSDGKGQRIVIYNEDRLVLDTSFDTSGEEVGVFGEFKFENFKFSNSAWTELSKYDELEFYVGLIQNGEPVTGVYYSSKLVVDLSAKFYFADNGDGTCTLCVDPQTQIQGKHVQYRGDITIPEYYDGKRVTKIGHGVFEGSTELTGVYIPDSITEIDGRAFYGCTSLEKISLPNTLKSIGEEAFYNCENLNLTSLPATVLAIGQNAFFNTKIWNDSENNDAVYLNSWCLGYKGDGINVALEDGTLRISYGAFRNNPNIESVFLNNNLKYIGDFAFAGCENLLFVVIPAKVERIGNSAFFNCTSLKNVIIMSYGASSTDSIKIEPYAFTGSGLQDIRILRYVNDVGTGAFTANENLSSIIISKNIKNIDSGAFSGGDGNFEGRITIYTEYEMRPDTWDIHWNAISDYDKIIEDTLNGTFSYENIEEYYIRRPVFWGCTLSVDKSYVVSFKKMEGRITDIGACNGISNPCRMGYTFGGWYTTIDFSGKAYSSEEIISFANNITFYAEWIPNEYDIIYCDQGGGKFSGDFQDDYPVTYATSDIEAYINIPTKIGYTFDGWYMDLECKGAPLWTVTLPTGEIYALLPANYGIDLTVYAKWTPQKYSINYRNIGGGVFDGRHELNFVKLYVYGEEINLDTPQKDGYSFVGWYNNIDGEGEAITRFNENNINGTEITLYAKWVPHTYQIIYKDIGGIAFSGGWKENYPTEHIYGNNTSLIDPVKIGYEFEGWYLEKDGSGTSVTYLSGMEYIGDITLYAKWINIEGFEFNLINDGTAYEISKATAVLNSKLVIPFTYNGLPVIKIADSGFSNSRISEVVIPDSIITIGEQAFKWSKVEIVTFESEISLEVIGSEAFAYCYNLNNIIIPASTKLIDTEAFYRCTLESITFAGRSVLESIGDSAFAYATIGSIEIPASVQSIEAAAFEYAKLENITFSANSELESIGDSAFAYATLGDINIPAGVQSVGVEAFYFSELESITFSTNIALESISNSVFARATIGSIEIPASVQSIEAEAFEYTKLENITFSANSELESIGDSAFAHATLGNINIPAGVQSIGVGAFYASDLGSITFSVGSELGSIGNSVFAHAEFSSINVPAGVQSLGTQAFYSSDFESITFAANSELKSIGNSAFAYAKFNSIEIPAGVQSIGAEAFSSSDLKSITFAANSALESIGSLAFSKCDLSSINIPVNVRTIGDEAFLDAEALTSVTFVENSALENIGEDAFRGCEQLTGIIIPKNVEAIGSGAFFGAGLSSVTFPENGSLEDIGNSAFYGCNLIEVSIPESVIHIGDSAFSGNGSLSTVNISTGSILESIGKTAFKGCNIESIHIPGNVISIGAEAFRSNFNLEEIVFASNATLTTIGNYAFADCDKLTSFYLPANVSDVGNAIVYGNSLIQLSVDSQNLTYTAEGNCIIRKSDNVLMLGCRASIIPQYVTSIADYAFYECQELTNITIPDTVTSIGEYAFAKCGITTIALPKVTFIGEWAFRDCELEQVSFSNTLVEIDAYAFWNCQLTELVLPNSIRTIGTSAFSGCDSLENVAFPEGLMSIGYSAFYSCENLTSISIPASVDSIGDGAFSFCLNLESITIDKANSVYSGDGNCIIRKSDNTLLFGFKTSIIPNYVQKIGNEAFYRSKILSLDIPYGVTEIGERAFMGSNITYLTMPNTVTTIGDGAFDSCDDLKELIIPESVTTIGDEAFYWCTGLEEITVPANVVSMGEYVFGSWNEEQVIYVEAPASMLEVWNTKWLADCWARIEWKAAEDYFTPGLEFIDVDGMSYVVAAGTSLSNGRETVVIPATYEGYPVVGIADYGFYACEVTNIVFVPNDEFVSIGEYAFAESWLKSINLPNTVEYIGQYAFARCYDLAITLPVTMGWLEVDDTWFDEASGITIYTEYYRGYVDEKLVDTLTGSGCIVWECVLSEEDFHVIAIVHSEDNIYDYDLVNPYRKGYEFIGWSTVPDSTEAEYTSEDLINWNVPMEEDSIILYAVWVALED